MRVVMARKAGFCMGVRRAVQLALKAAQEAEKPVYTYGPLIHNPQTLKLLEVLGIKVLKEIPERGKGTVIIRAHGVPPEEKERLKKAGFKVIDGTCPRVLRVQALARRFSQEGYHVIIIGDPDHAEVKGILGYAGERGIVVSNFRDLEKLPPLEKYVILSQTTQDEEFFELIAEEILKRFPGGKVYNTICNATHNRQQEVRRLCRECEAIVVVGGKHSANTNRLAMIAREEGRDVFLVETAEELDLEALKKYRKVGVTAGASTPNWVINQVIRTLEQVPSPHESPWRRLVRKGIRFLFESNLALALGAVLLSAAVLLLTAKPLAPALLLLAGGFLFSAHTVNRLVDLKALKLNDPFRAAFLERYRLLFGLASVAGYGLSLFLAASLSREIFFLLLGLTLASVLYSLPFMGRRHLSPVQRLPGARSLFIALGWTAVIVLVPALWFGPERADLWAGGIVFCLAALRAIFLELLELQGDGFVGKETLPVFLGEERTFLVLRGLLVLFGLFLLGGLLTKDLPRWSLGLLPSGLYVYYVLRSFEKRLLGRGLFLETLAEGIPWVFSLNTFLVYLGAAWKKKIWSS